MSIGAAAAAGALAPLRWLGRHAAWVLAVGSVAALFAPELASAARPTLPYVLALLYMLAFARVDPLETVRRALAPRRLAGALGLVLLMLAVTPAALWAAAQALSLGPDAAKALVYTGAAPPIASAAGLCFLLGLDAAAALQLTVLGNLLAPVIGPAVVVLLLGEAVPLEPLTLSLRLTAIIGGGLVLAIVLRRLLGANRIEAGRQVFDGLGAIGMLCFILPLFDGVGPLIAAQPLTALAVLALAVAVNFGMQAAAVWAARRRAPEPVAGALGVAWGNRTVALYVAALPPDPAFGLFVALYQFPMYFTPLALRGVLYRRVPSAENDRN